MLASASGALQTQRSLGYHVEDDDEDDFVLAGNAVELLWRLVGSERQLQNPFQLHRRPGGPGSSKPYQVETDAKFH